MIAPGKSWLLARITSIILMAEVGRKSVAKAGADLFDAPDGATLVKLTFFPDERRGAAAKDPNVKVSRLLADDRSDHSSDTAEFNVNDKIHGLSSTAADGKRNLAGGLDRDVDQPREIVERSGVAPPNPNLRNDRNASESAARQAIRRSDSLPSK